MKSVPAILCVLALICAQSSESAKILSVFQIPSPSHYIYGSAILKELAARGHEVTSVTVYPQKKPIANFTDVFIDTNTNIIEDLVGEAETQGGQNAWKFLSDFTVITANLCNNLLEHPAFQEIMKQPQGTYDLLIVEVIFTESLHGLREHFNVPIIGVSTFGTNMGIDDIVGNSSPASIVPSSFVAYSSQMTLLERINNFYEHIKFFYLFYYKSYYMQKTIYEKYFPNAKLSFEESRKNFSLLIINQHYSLSYPRPYVPNLIEAGGLHIPPKIAPLPEDLQRFLDNATEGVVYFSLGSNIKSKELPFEKRQIFLNVFRGLKQKVLWKFEDPELPGKPDNVFISSWLPQHAVLKHPNVKVFMTHGGLLSTTEAIYFGKPILGFPIFADQPRNVILVVKRGIALAVELKQLNEPELKHKLNELLLNPSYSEKMKAISWQYHDKPMTSMENAMYWIEYVIRHKGAYHLKNAGEDLTIWQYYSIDVIGIIFSVLFIATSIMILAAKTIYSKIVSGDNSIKIKNN